MAEIKAEETPRGGFEIIGQPLRRKEDARLLTGQGRFVDDIDVPGALHVCFVRSPHAHARIRLISTERARAAPGVVAVVTARELMEWTTTFRMAPPIEGLRPTEITTLPLAKVRFQGDPVACVVAADRYLAEDAAEQVEVDYEVLEPVTDMFRALQPTAPLVDESLPSNLVAEQRFAAGNVEQRFAEADHVVEATFSQHRQTHVPIEPRGCLGLWDEGRQHLTFMSPNQAPHPFRTALAGRLRLKESQVTVISPDIGGGFGQKIALFREELTVAALARALKAPVRWTEDRMENLLASLHARQNRVKVRAAVAKSGRLLGLEAEIMEDFGAYSFFPANYHCRVIGLILPGPYKFQDYVYEVKSVFTNKCGAGPMRCPMAIASWVIEGTMDAIARRLGLDPVEVRRINMVKAEDLPYVTATGERLEDITPAETLDRALAEIDYEGFRKRQTEARKKGKYLGLGICVAVESTTYGSKQYKTAGIPGSGHEAAWVRIGPSGAVSASVGMMTMGQGYETAFAQAVAEGLGVDAGDVTLLLGNTDVAPYGMGSRGSRGGTAGGGTLYLAGLKARDKVLTIAAALLGLNTAGQLRMRMGVVERQVGGAWTETGLKLADVARVAYLDPLRLPAGMEPGLEVQTAYDPPPMTWSNATHVCEVELRPASGKIDILRYLIVEDCGTVLNPMIVDGQQHGATVMGIGGVLLEHVIYDEHGQNVTATLADYLLPTACEAPKLEIVSMHTPNRRTPAGLKGMAEGGVMGAIGAVCNAVNDALAPFGVVAERQPLSPDYIRSLLRDKAAPKERGADRSRP